MTIASQSPTSSSSLNAPAVSVPLLAEGEEKEMERGGGSISGGGSERMGWGGVEGLW